MKLGWMEIGIGVLALYMLTRGKTAEAGIPSITAISIAPSQVQLVGSGPVTPIQLLEAVAEQVDYNPSLGSVRVISPGLDYTVDVPSTVEAARVSGMDYQAWLNLYGAGIAP